MKVTTLLFIAWFILFVFWIAKQFRDSNRRDDERLKALQSSETQE